MDRLPNEFFFEIFIHLKNYRRSLFSCLLVNRHWCRNVIPILWRELDVSKSRKLIEICTLSLNAEEKEQLLSLTTILPNNQNLLFEYLTYTTTIKIDSDDGIMNWLNHKKSVFEPLYSPYDLRTERAIQAIKSSLISMFLRTSKRLKNLSISGEILNMSEKIFDKCTALVSLKFANNNISLEESKTLAKSLHNNTNLTSLDLWNNRMGPEGGKALADALALC
ncbi:hypothetical protein F8M41_025079 [Gigaspora margarita]|uniref:F-box domain-containing protein n=1 Tax=Gigaspora margarita TaxID=4874 RepID=A0A8H4B069_GIGMA|nr:hypothetical protein F8M41_025079 [Gigaspora margarita]